MVPEGNLPNHTLVVPYSVVGKALYITSSRVICKSIKVLNDSMWSKGSFEPSKDSNWGRQNYGGSGWFNTSMVNGESVLLIILSKFSMALSFIAFLSSFISLLMLRSSFSILDEFSSSVLVLLFAWLFDPSSLWIPSTLQRSSSFWFSRIHYRSSFWDSAALLNSSFWRVTSSKVLGLGFVVQLV